MTSTYKSRTTPYMSRYAKMYRGGYRLTVPSLGDMRRIQGLRRIGYTTRAIGAGTGLSHEFVSSISHGKEVRIGVQAHKRIVVFYDEHSWHPRSDTSAKKGMSYAKKYGWAPPGAWDNVDDPNDKPKGVL